MEMMAVSEGGSSADESTPLSPMSTEHDEKHDPEEADKIAPVL